MRIGSRMMSMLGAMMALNMPTALLGPIVPAERGPNKSKGIPLRDQPIRGDVYASPEDEARARRRAKRWLDSKRTIGDPPRHIAEKAMFTGRQ